MKKLSFVILLMLSLWSVEAYSDGLQPINYWERSVTGSGTNTSISLQAQTCSEYTVLTSSSGNTELGAGWYVLTENVTYDGVLKFTEDAHLILCDKATLTANKGIVITGTKTLTIYSSSDGNDAGAIVARAASNDVRNGIGGANPYANLIIHGGHINAYGYAGGSKSKNDFNNGIGVFELTILGGTIYAKGGGYCGGLGNSAQASDNYVGFIKIYGGNVTAEGSEYSAGICCGSRGSGPLYIYGGTVTATGGAKGAGIGSGSYGIGWNGGNGGQKWAVNIYGGEVTANGGTDAAGIGGGENEFGGEVNIYGGIVHANGNDYGAGIGGGEDGNGGRVTINGGTVYAKAGRQSGSGNRAIGPGNGSDSYGTLNIGNAMTVWAGTESDYSGKHFSKDQRAGVCWYSPYAKIAVCDHTGCTYSVNGTTNQGTHTRLCQFCKVDFEAEPHSFNNNVCTVCGVGATAYTASVWMPNQNVTYGYVSTSFDMVPGSQFTLPSCPITPPGLEFAGWLVGTATGLTSYVTTGSETLLAEGAEYTINSAVNFTARFREINISLADNADNIETIIAYYYKTVSQVTLTGRTLTKDGKWNTLCLPFNVDDISTSPLAGATIKELDNSAEGTSLSGAGELTLKFKTATAIEAGKPYIIKWDNTSGTISAPVFTGVTFTSISPTEVVSNDGKVKFVGQFSPFSIDEDDLVEILYVASGNKIGYSSKVRTLKSCRAHFWVKPNDGEGSETPSPAALMINVDFDDDEITGITNTDFTDRDSSDSYNSCSKANAWYSLDGRRLDSKPTQKGIYIVNGRKVVIK